MTQPTCPTLNADGEVRHLFVFGNEFCLCGERRAPDLGPNEIELVTRKGRIVGAVLTEAGRRLFEGPDGQLLRTKP